MAQDVAMDDMDIDLDLGMEEEDPEIASLKAEAAAMEAVRRCRSYVTYRQSWTVLTRP